ARPPPPRRADRRSRSRSRSTLLPDACEPCSVIVPWAKGGLRILSRAPERPGLTARGTGATVSAFAAFHAGASTSPDVFRAVPGPRGSRARGPGRGPPLRESAPDPAESGEGDPQTRAHVRGREGAVPRPLPPRSGSGG